MTDQELDEAIHAFGRDEGSTVDRIKVLQALIELRNKREDEKNRVCNIKVQGDSRGDRSRAIG